MARDWESRLGPRLGRTNRGSSDLGAVVNYFCGPRNPPEVVYEHLPWRRILLSLHYSEYCTEPTFASLHPSSYVYPCQGLIQTCGPTLRVVAPSRYRSGQVTAQRLTPI
eukprot:jgi/Botrbrau1/6947/Bobra.0215s0024.1